MNDKGVSQRINREANEFSLRVRAILNENPADEWYLH
jgi:hypothetical protein